MNEHFIHLFPSLVLFLAIGWILLKKRLSYSKLSLIGITICLITIFTFPIHTIHASHMQMQKHDCCLPVPVEVPTFFELNAPQPIVYFDYQLISPSYIAPNLFSLNSRSPPIS
jgi:hypothetical protein